MKRELRIIGFLILSAAGLSVFTAYSKQSRKPVPVSPPVTEAEPEPRPVPVIQIYKTPSDQAPQAQEQSPPRVLDPIKDFPETTTAPLSPQAPPAPSAIVEPSSSPRPTTDICEKYHMHKRYTNNGKSWRCARS